MSLTFNKSSIPGSPVNKRKRVEMESYLVRKLETSDRRLYVLKSSLVNSSYDITSAQIFKSGDVILWHDDKLDLLRDIINNNEPTISDLPLSDYSIKPLESLFVISINLDNTELIGCSTKGDMIILSIEDDGRVAYNQHSLRLHNEDDKVTALCKNGNVIVVGTSAGELFLNYRKGVRGAMEVTHMAKQSLLFGLVESGVKLLGFSTSRASDKAAVVRLVAFTTDRPDSGDDVLLLCATSTSLALWADWTGGRSGRFLWETDIRTLLRTASHTHSVALHDVLVLQIANSREVLLVVLALVTAAEGGGSELWLNLMDVSLDAGPVRADTGPPVSLRQRLHIAANLTANTSNACLHGVVSSSSPSASLHPGLCSSWLVYASWVGPGETVQVGQYDIRTLPPASAPVVAPPAALETNVPSKDVLCIGAVSDIDGLLLVMRDQVLVAVPPLTRSSRTAVPVAVEDIQDPGALLRALVTGQAGQGVFPELRAALSRLQALKIADMTRKVAIQIVDEAPSSPGASAGFVLEEKCDRLRLLEDALLRLDVLGEEGVTEVLQTSKDMVAASSAIYVGLMDLQRRQGDLALSVTAPVLGDASKVGRQVGMPRVLQEALDLVQEGIQAAVRSRTGSVRSSASSSWQNDLEAFFAQVSQLPQGLHAIARALERRYAVAGAASGFVIGAAYSLLPLFLATLRAASASGSSIVGGFLCRPETRAALSSLLAVLRQIAVSGAASGLGYNVALRPEAEGQRLLELSNFLLNGYSAEAIAMSPKDGFSEQREASGERLPEPEKLLFQSAKDLCLDSLLAAGLAEQSFALAVSLVHPRALMEAAATSPVLASRLPAVLADYGTFVGSLPFPETLASGCFRWLDDGGQGYRVLELGQNCVDQLHAFVQDRPHLAWAHCIDQRDYLTAARHALALSDNSERAAGRARTLANIAVLCAHVSEDPDSAMVAQLAAQRQVYFLAQQRLGAVRPSLVSDDQVMSPTQVATALVNVVEGGDSSRGDFCLLLSTAIAVVSHKRDEMKLRASNEDASVTELLVRIWRTAVTAEMNLWASLAFGGNADQFVSLENLWSDSLLYALLSASRRDAADSHLRTDVLLEADGPLIKEVVRSVCASSNQEPQRLQFLLVSCVGSVSRQIPLQI